MGNQKKFSYLFLNTLQKDFENEVKQNRDVRSKTEFIGICE